MWSCPPPIKLKVDNILVYSHRAGFLKKTKKVRKWWQCEVVMHPAALICPVILDCKWTEENIKGLMPDSRLLLDKDLCPIVFIPNTRLETGLLRVWRFYTLIDVRNHNSLLRKTTYGPPWYENRLKVSSSSSIIEVIRLGSLGGVMTILWPVNSESKYCKIEMLYSYRSSHEGSWGACPDI